MGSQSAEWVLQEEVEGGRKDRGEGERGEEGDQLTDVVPRVQEPCLFSAGELEEGPGLGAGREISGSCLQVQIPAPPPTTTLTPPLPTPPFSVCVCAGARRWHSSPEPLPSPLKIRW